MVVEILGDIGDGKPTASQVVILHARLILDFSGAGSRVKNRAPFSYCIDISLNLFEN